MSAVPEKLKKFLPTGLFGRSFLILLIPTLLVQLVAAYFFYERHWDSVSTHMYRSLAGDIAFLSEQTETTLPARREEEIFRHAREKLEVRINYTYEKQPEALNDPDLYPDFQEVLQDRMHYPYVITLRSKEDAEVLIEVGLSDGTLNISFSRKRLENPTTYIFMLWMSGAALLLLIIATLFLRNQMRPIAKLAEAAEEFGKGLDSPPFKPHGAREVRKAARAFNFMRERIRRQIATRTAMLAGISHDLRTPLTRLNLQLAMLEQKGEKLEGMRADIQEMERMIQEYLNFAKGYGGEEPVAMSLSGLIRDLASDYARQHQEIELDIGQELVLSLRLHAMRRALSNLINNGLKYGKHVGIALARQGSEALITILDDGPGIPEEQQEQVFQPFKRLEDSRNPKTGGAGLGLTITRDIIHAHGGEIMLRNRPEGGLMVMITLPL